MESPNTWMENGYIAKNEQHMIENVEVMSKRQNGTVVKVLSSSE